jgi:peptide/nickel transport system substrate-binding protein
MGMTMRLILLAAVIVSGCAAQSELRFTLRVDPKTFDPLLASEEASEAVRYMTGGVLLRFNRATQQLQPELAKSWKVQDGGKRIDFVLREGVRFSDGSTFGAEDVIATVRRLNDAALRSATADEFRAGGQIAASTSGASSVSIIFTKPIAGVEYLFDRLSIGSSDAGPPERAVLGPFVLAEYKAGQHVLLRRNPHYWKMDTRGKRLPYADGVRLYIQANRDQEVLRFRRGELDLVDRMEPELFERLRKESPKSAVDAGPSMDSEFVWFNQVPNAPMPEYKRAWFQSQRFRRAISAALKRDDVVRLVYRGFGSPAVGPVAQSNRVWYNAKLRVQAHDPKLAHKLLKEDGFRMDGQTLRDRSGNAVEFSLITNAGSKTRGQIGTMIQADLKEMGIRVNFVPLEFQSLIERITRTNNYEACLLGFTNVELDPNAQMNVWLSSSTHHAWNPGQKSPATPWEAEIDRLMERQAAATDLRGRKAAFDRVQEIVFEQTPFVYLVHPNVLLAVSPSVRNAQPAALPPHLYWNIEYLAK